jgi:hypothetical protein
MWNNHVEHHQCVLTLEKIHRNEDPVCRILEHLVKRSASARVLAIPTIPPGWLLPCVYGHKITCIVVEPDPDDS